MGYQVVEMWAFLKIGVWLFVKVAQTGPWFMGQVAWWGVRKKGTSPWWSSWNEIGCVILPTLAGQVGLGVWLASWSPNQLDLWGLVLATNQVGKHLSFSSTPWVIKFWKMLTFWKIGLWLFLKDAQSDPCFMGQVAWWGVRKGYKHLVVNLKMNLDLQFCPPWLVKLD